MAARHIGVTPTSALQVALLTSLFSRRSRKHVAHSTEASIKTWFSRRRSICAANRGSSSFPSSLYECGEATGDFYVVAKILLQGEGNLHRTNIARARHLQRLIGHQDQRNVEPVRGPVKNLLDYLAAGDSIDEFLEQFPTVQREQAVGLIELAKRLVLASADESTH